MSPQFSRTPFGETVIGPLGAVGLPRREEWGGKVCGDKRGVVLPAYGSREGRSRPVARERAAGVEVRPIPPGSKNGQPVRSWRGTLSCRSQERTKTVLLRSPMDGWLAVRLNPRGVYAEDCLYNFRCVVDMDRIAWRATRLGSGPTALSCAPQSTRARERVARRRLRRG